MLDRDSLMIVIDSDRMLAERSATVLSALDFKVRIVGDSRALHDLIGEGFKIAGCLVAADDNYHTLESALKIADDAQLQCAFFLMEREAVRVQPSAVLRSRLRAILPYGVGSQELFSAPEAAGGGGRTREKPSGLAAGVRFHNLVGSSKEMQAVRDLIKQVADTDATVLITGESGTGKEAVAGNIHRFSGRGDKPFVPVNCGAIPSELLESELFGHEKGAFTGAVNSRKGRFEIAEGGTLFLDEIGDMPMDMQIKLLRVLQERTFERVGSNKVIQANVRIVAATHQHLEQLVAEGKFRMDLFYRLNVFPIQVAPLRERTADIPQLLESFNSKREKERLDTLDLSEGALACLAKYYWPGNVRELFNLLERLSILYPRQAVTWSHLPDKFRPNQELFDDVPTETAPAPVEGFSGASNAVLPHGGIDFRPHMADIESSLLTQALTQSDWVVARAAKLLNLQRTTLVEKIRKMGLQRPQELTDF